MSGLLAILTIALVFRLLGRFVGTAHGPLLFFSGWAIATVVMLAWGTLTALPISWSFYPLMAAAIGALLYYKRDAWPGGGAFKLVLLALPMLIAVAAMAPSQWDEFTNWLPSQRFLEEFDSFPRIGLPPSVSVVSAYPFGLPLIGHFAGVLTGGFVDNAGALFNALLIAILAALLAQVIALGLGTREPRFTWGMAALSLLLATALNPTFVPKLVFTTYVDFTTTVTATALAFAAWHWVRSLAAGDHSTASGFALQAGLAFAVLVNLKQPNLVIGVFIIATAGALTVLDSRSFSAWRYLPRLLGPALLVFALWRFHVLTQLPDGGEFAFRPFADWIWGDAGAILLQMVKVAAKKGGYVGLMLAATFMAVRGFTRTHDDLFRLAVISAGVFWTWNAFLFCSYLGSFGAGEGRMVASLWRYNTQLGGIVMLFAVYAGARLWRRFNLHWPMKWAAALGCAAVLASPLIAYRAVAFDREPPKAFVRIAAGEIAELVPAGSSIGVLDPLDNGEYMVFIRYSLYRKGTVQNLSNLDWSSPSALREALAGPELTHLWVRGPMAAAADAVGLALQRDRTYFLARNGSGWRVLREWPTTG
jgi:hypothetical protein